MWQTDTVVLLSGTKVNDEGVIKITWAASGSAVCDVQDINKEVVFKKYGIEGNEFKQVYDYNNAAWVEGDQCQYAGVNYWIKLVRVYTKMGNSNHTYVILEKV